MKYSDPVFQKACKLTTRCYKNKIKNDDTLAVEPSNKKFRAPGGGRKVRVLDVRESLFEWFLDVRTSSKARLPRTLFEMKYEEIYKTWLSGQSEEVRQNQKENTMMFSNQWVKD